MAEENIVIKIKADVGITKEVIDAVTKAMENLGKTATIVTGNVKVTNKNLEDTNKILGQVAQTATGADKAIGSAGNSVKKSNQQWMSLALVVQDLPYGFRGIQNNLPALLGGIAGVGGAAYLAFSVIISGLTFWDEHNRKVAASTKKVKEEQDQLFKGVSDEAVKVNELIQVLKNETETRDRKKRAIKELQTINIDVFKDLKLEGDKVDGLNTYYNKYIENLKNVILLKQYEKDLETIIQAELKTGKPLQAAKQKELKNSTQLLNTNNTAVKDNIAVNKVSALKDIKVIDNINQYNNSQQKKLDLLEKIRKISPAVALGGGTNNKSKAEPKEKVSDYNEKEAAAEFDFYKNSLFQAEFYFNKLNEIRKTNALMKGVIDGASINELLSIQKTYEQYSINFAQQTEDKKFAIRQQSFQRQKTLTEKHEKDVYDGQVKYASDYIKVLDIQLKTELKLHKNSVELQKEDIRNKIKQIQFAMFFAAGNQKAFDAFGQKLKELQGQLGGFGDISKQVADILHNSLVTGIQTLGTTIGESLATGKFDFTALGNVFADALTTIGNALIAYALTSKAAIEALKAGPLGWGIALGAGILAVAAGAFLKSKVNEQKSTAFANGGIVSGPTMGLVGEYPGAKSNPEVIAPLDKLKSMIGGGGGGQFTLRGQDLLLAVNRAQKASNLKGQNISLA